MSAVAPRYADENPLYDPDDVQGPEPRAHRRLCELVALATAHALGERADVVRNLNLYPTGEQPLAPDVMVLPAGTVPRAAKSYQPGEVGGPLPDVVVEVPSDSDAFTSFRSKLHRYQRLGVPVYVLYAEPSEPGVERLLPDELHLQPWVDVPCPELGGIAFAVEDGRVALRLADGTVVHEPEQWLGLLAERADRADRLAARLRELGVDPDSV